MSAFDGSRVLSDHKYADLDLDNEEGQCSTVASTTCSPTLSPQEMFGTMVDALLEDGSAKDSVSTADCSDCDSTEDKRWSDLMNDDDSSEFNASSNTDERHPYFSWLEAMEQDWSSEQNWPSEMNGFQWVPVAVMPMHWTPSMDDSLMFSYGETPAFDIEEVSDGGKPVKAPTKWDATAHKTAAEKKSEEATKRKGAKKRAAAAKRFPKPSSPPSSAPKIKVPAEREPTTIMIRNIPKGCTRARLQSMFESEGFRGQYDFLYLPYSFDDWSILGHAFINFPEHCDAERAVTDLNSRALFPDVEDKLCEVCWSKALQGLAPCIGRFRNSPVMHESVEDKYKPIMLADDRRVDFPEATREIQLVRR